MAKYGKSYEVSPRIGKRQIYRDGVFVGTWPEFGYTVKIIGRMTCLAATEIAAHAEAEARLEVSPYSRKWVLTEEEYEENRYLLAKDNEALLSKYPYSLSEQNAVDAQYSRYARVSEQGMLDIKNKLLNIDKWTERVAESRYRRPSEFPTLPDDNATPPAPRMG